MRLIKYNENDPGNTKLSNAHDEIDPINKNRFDNVKKLHSYVQRELSNMKTYMDLQRRKNQEYVPFFSTVITFC